VIKSLTPHFGSLSIGIACDDLGFELDACEIDADYYEAGKERLRAHQLKKQEIKEFGFAKTEISKQQPILF